LYVAVSFQACCWSVAQRRTAAQLKVMASVQHPLARGLLHDKARTEGA
jgi:hypothetical protein